MQLKNYMEEVVWSELNDILVSHPEVCHCENCCYDIVALTLNKLVPRYVVTDKGETYTKVNNLRMQFKVDIISALANAIQIVATNPRH